MLNKEKILRFLINVGTSGKYSGNEKFVINDYFIRYILMNCIVIFGGIILLLFTAANIKNKVYIDAVICGSMFIVSIITFILSRSKLPHTVPMYLCTLLYGVMSILLVWIGEAEGGFLFIYMFPLLSILQIGMLNGIIFSTVLIILVSLKMFIPELSNSAYNLNVSIRMFVGYILVLFVMVVIETTRKAKDKMIEEQNQRLQELKEEAEIANRTKSSFLAGMSHEIRTPMNAITGIAEMLLREDLSDKMRSYVLDIKHAGNNLISIINDILDISKIEAGKLEIINTNYFLSSMINDAINSIRARLAEKQLISFYTIIDETIPNSLIGDETRLRQICINILSNAVKYTEKGEIKFSITKEKINNNQIWLKIAASDTGKGIKPEDKEKLFGAFVQVDMKKNYGIEGTGLGLAITKKLCIAMGGDITVESEYGKGSTFTVIIPQVIYSHNPIGPLENAIKNIDVEIFEIKYTIPKARLLVVDDIPTNLKVAEGLLKPYRAIVDTCLNGRDSIEMIKQNNYDLVFMDHMMPETDGIETTEIIRAWEKEKSRRQIPIIALTANAITGMREMFIKKGFNDLLAKPIDIIKLNEILDRYINDEKKEQITTAGKPAGNEYANFNIPGVDIKKGIALTGGTMAQYRKVLSMFCKDAKERLVLLQSVPNTDTLRTFIIHVHSLKSASATLGAMEVSLYAAALEEAGKSGNMPFINEKLPVFVKHLTELVENIRDAINKTAPETSASFAPSLLFNLSTALEKQNASEINRILKELSQKPLDSKTTEVIEKINTDIIMAEYGNAIKTIKGFLNPTK